MHITVERSALVRELELAQGAIEKRSTIPVCNCVQLTAGKALGIMATDLEIGLATSCEAEVHSPGSVCVPAKRLLDYVRLLSAGKIEMKEGPNSWLSIKSGRSNTRIAGIGSEAFPELPGPLDEWTEIPSGTLKELIHGTMFAISVQESRFSLNAALLELDGSLRMITTDGHRLSIREAPVQGKSRALIPRKALIAMLKLCESENVHFGQSDQHLFLRAGHRLLISRKTSGNFPDHARIIDQELPHSAVVPVTPFRDALERARLMADERSQAIRMTFAPGELSIHSSLSDTGDTDEVVPIDYSGPQIETGMNAGYLVEFLKVIGAGNVTIGLKDARSAIRLQPVQIAEGHQHTYLVMPMKI